MIRERILHSRRSNSCGVAASHKAVFETLEDRRLWSVSSVAAIAITPRPLPLPPPPIVPGTFVDLQTTPRTVVVDALAGTATKDKFRVYLQQGEFLKADIDALPLAGISQTSLAVTNAVGSAVAVQAANVDPETGVSDGQGALGFRAPATGHYDLTVSTTDPDGGGYLLELNRVALAAGKQDSARLQATTGALTAALSGDRLLLRGPTGYGFAIRGTWTQSLTAFGRGLGSTQYASTYIATGPLFLQTAFGEVQFAVPAGQTFSVATKANVFGKDLGEVAGISTAVGLPLGTFSQTIQSKFGLNISSISLGDKWKIQLGSTIKSERGIDQALSAVPYIVYADKAGYRAEFGGITVTNTESDAATVVFADPADPSLYVKAKNFAFQGSLKGFVPYTPYSSFATQTPVPGLNGFFGHIYAHGDFPISGLPLKVGGDVVINLDANSDGQFAGGQANASQLFSRTGISSAAVATALRDVKIGVNGNVSFGYNFAGYNLAVPLGQASAVYDGLAQSISFKGGTVDPWKGTPLEKFVITAPYAPLTTFQGSILAGGKFNVTATNTYKVLGARADVSITLANAGVTASAKINVLGQSAHLTGTLYSNGNFTLLGSASLHFGPFDGSASFLLKRVGTISWFTANLTGSAKWSAYIVGTKWTASASLSSQVRIVATSTGSLTYSGSVSATGKVTSPIGSIGFELSANISGNAVVFSFPKIGKQTLTLP
jgi:hypothetical protein